MSTVFLVISHCIALAAGFAFGRLRGFKEAQPERDTKGRFIKRS